MVFVQICEVKGHWKNWTKHPVYIHEAPLTWWNFCHKKTPKNVKESKLLESVILSFLLCKLRKGPICWIPGDLHCLGPEHNVQTGHNIPQTENSLLFSLSTALGDQYCVCLFQLLNGWHLSICQTQKTLWEINCHCFRNTVGLRSLCEPTPKTSVESTNTEARGLGVRFAPQLPRAWVHTWKLRSPTVFLLEIRCFSSPQSQFEVKQQKFHLGLSRSILCKSFYLSQNVSSQCQFSIQSEVNSKPKQKSTLERIHISPQLESILLLFWKYFTSIKRFCWGEVNFLLRWNIFCLRWTRFNLRWNVSHHEVY